MFNRPHSSKNHARQGGTFAEGTLGTLFFLLSLAYFGGKAMFFALRIRERVFPDEASWFGISQVFSRAAWLPVDSPESYPFGLVTHIPSLYFFLMGKMLSGNFLPLGDLLFLRMANVALALLTVIFAWRLAGRGLALSLPVRCLFMVMLTNTVMFTFVSGAVSYDNLATLFAVLSLYFLIRFFRERSLRQCLLFSFFVLAGLLTKNVMVPYGAALVLVALFHERRNLAALPKSLPLLLTALKWRESLLLTLCLGALAATLALYGGNLLRYDTLLPGMERVLPIEACLQNRIFARDYVVRQFKSGQMTLLDAQRLALLIRDPGDRASAWGQLLGAAKGKEEAPPVLMGRWRYALEWGQVIVARSYSVAAHLSLFKKTSDFYPYYAVFALALALGAFRFRFLMVPGMGSIGFVALFYTMVLMQVVGYQIYRNSGFSGVALTGRYLFPVLVPVYLLTAQALLAKMPRWWQVAIGLTVAVLFISGEFPWFFLHAGPEWYF